jgi:hypothetical protein
MRGTAAEFLFLATLSIMRLLTILGPRDVGCSAEADSRGSVFVDEPSNSLHLDARMF